MLPTKAFETTGIMNNITSAEAMGTISVEEATGVVGSGRVFLGAYPSAEQTFRSDFLLASSETFNKQKMIIIVMIIMMI